MIFSVIYSVDFECNDPIRHDTDDDKPCDHVETHMDFEAASPPQDQLDADLWQKTEGDEEYDIGIWEAGHHRKWCALLDKEQFMAFIEQCCLCAEDVETGGSLGAPGLGYGCSPAISFDCEAYSYYGNAYVTPIPDKFERKEGRERDQDRDWDRIKQAVVSQFG